MPAKTPFRRRTATGLAGTWSRLLALAALASVPVGAAAQYAAGPGMPGATPSPSALGDTPLAAPFPSTSPRGVEIRSGEPTPRELEQPRGPSEEAALGPRAPRADPRPEPRPEPTDFQLFAATSVGKVLPIFGQSLFTAAPSTFAPVLDVPPSAEYVVGPGDEILIRGWGQVDIDVRAVVTREGTISIPRVGVLSVAGTRYEDLPKRIKAAVSRFYRNFELSVSLGRLRSIQVFVVGHARKPGLFTVSSFSTLLNALFASGGPSSSGSMRQIQLRRADKTVAELDLYDILLRGDKSRDARLLSGDVIFIPPVGPLAAVAGPVKTPAVFELAEKATLADLLDYAGGLTTTAATHSVLLERLDQQRGRVVEDLAWSDAALATPLRGGDVVQLRTVSPRYDNAVTVRGSVIAPFRTAWRQGLTVADLIPDRKALVSNAYWARAAARAIERPAATTRKEGEAAQRELQERVRTEVENLVDEVNWDYALIERLDPARLEPRLIPFNLGKAIIDRDPAQNPALEPGDIVTVFSLNDIKAPAAKRTYFVRIEGEVAVPGVYQVTPGETLRQLVQRAGGFTPSAYLFGAEFDRQSVRKDQQARLEEITFRAEQELERSAAERLSRALSADETQSVRSQLEAQRAAIARLKTLRATGRMVLELKPEARTVEDLPQLALEEGDFFFVPIRYSTVGVYGSVYNQSNFIHKPGKKVDDYLKLAGGPTRSADSGSVYVLRADGSVFSKRQSGWFGSFGGRELMPNDNVVVPEDYAPTSVVKELKDWSQIFYQFGLGIAALKVIGLF